LADKSLKTGADRRRFFRIDDSIRLTYRPISSEELEELVKELDAGHTGNFTVMSSLTTISSQMAVSMRRIENIDADIAAYLKALDKKIEVLGRAFLSQEKDAISSVAMPVNISAGGISLDARAPLEKGQLVEVKLLLFPSFTGLMAYGEVIHVHELTPEQKHEDYSHELRIEFKFMREQDRDILIRHVLRRQGEELRRRREEKDNS